MNALIHQSAAVAGPPAAPKRLIVVCLIPIPANVDRAVGKLPEAASLSRCVHLLCRGIKAVLVTYRSLYVVCFRFGDDLPRVRHAHGNGFFNDDVYAAANAVQRDFCMFPAVRGDGHQFKLVFFQHGPVIAVLPDACAVHAHTVKQALGLACVKITGSYQFQTVLADGLHML